MIDEHWEKLLSALSTKIEIVDEIDILEIVINPYKTLTDLEKYVNFKFKPNQRLIITQIDTLFFIKNTSYSISLYNLFVIVSHLGIPTEHILILTNQNISNEIKTLSKIFDLTPMKVFVSCYNNIQTTPSKNISNLSLSENLINYPYINLNGLKRSARILLLCILENRNLIDKGLVTWSFSKPNTFNNFNSAVNENKTVLPLIVSGNGSLVNDSLFLDNEYREIFNKFSKKFLDSTQTHQLITVFDKSNDSQTFQPKFLQNALIYLVSETVVDYPYPYLSEKTFKGFLVKRPMIICGAPYSIAQLKDLGFKTWGDFWDESYDNLTFMPDRLNAICNIIEDFSRLSIDQLQDTCIKMKDILEYNYHWYINEFANNQLEKLVQNTDV